MLTYPDFTCSMSRRYSKNKKRREEEEGKGKYRNEPNIQPNKPHAMDFPNLSMLYAVRWV